MGRSAAVSLGILLGAAPFPYGFAPDFHSAMAADVPPAAECADALGIPASQVRITQQISEAKDASLVLLDGAGATLHLGTATPGLCVVLGGESASVELTLAAPVHRLFIKAAGNRGTVRVTLAAGGRIEGGRIHLAGHGNAITLAGDAEAARCDALEWIAQGSGGRYACADAFAMELSTE